MKPVLFSTTHLKECFSNSYHQAQEKFRGRVHDLHDHSRYMEFVYRETGPEGEKLCTSVAWQGSPDAPRVLVIQSATHGVEGFAGSAIQLDTLSSLSPDSLPDDVGILHIHAVNPYGFAWLRRVNEQGVDLNRNFIDFSKPLPDNPVYGDLASDLLPADSDNWEISTQRLWQYREAVGEQAFEQAVTGGQYQFPKGLFYGGKEPSQSRRYLEALTRRLNLASKQKIAVVDIHTGLGPFGYGEVICDHPPDSTGVQWARQWYGDSVTEPAMGSSSSVPKVGLIDYYWHQVLADRVCFVTLEFGTYPMDRLLETLRQDHFLHTQVPDWGSVQTQKTKAAIKKNFYPGSSDWQEMVLMRGRQIILQAINGLSAEQGQA